MNPILQRSNFRPFGYNPPKGGLPGNKMAQAPWVQVNPQIQAPISIGLGALPLSFGLFAGSAVSFLVGTQVPGIRLITTIAGIGLAGAGVVNLFIGGKAPAAATPTTGPVTPGQASAPIAPTLEEAFNAIDGRVISPQEGDTVNVQMFGTPKVPVRVRLSNSSPSPASFDLLFQVTEDPSVGEILTSRQNAMRIDLGPGETRDIDTAISVNSWGTFVTTSNITVQVQKKRIAGGESVPLVTRYFTVD